MLQLPTSNTSGTAAELDAYDEDGLTLLNKAIGRGNTSQIAQFLESGAAKDRLNRTGESNIYYAVVHKNRKVIHFLLEQGFNCNLKNTDGNTSLHEAVRQQRTDIVYILMQSHANPNSVNKDGKSPLGLAASNSTIKAILNRPSPSNVMPFIAATDDMNALFMAVQNQNQSTEDIKSLIKSNMLLKAIDEYGYSLMHYAILEGRIDVVKLLIEHNPELVNAWLLEGGRTPLYLAVYSKQADVVALLLSKNADPKKANGNGRTPMDEAITIGDSHPAILDKMTVACTPWRTESNQLTRSNPSDSVLAPQPTQLSTIEEVSDEEVRSSYRPR